MVWSKRLLTLFIAIFVLIPVVYSAEQFYVEITPINDKIYIDESESASFTLRIINNLGINDEFRIYTLDFPLWSIYSGPGEYSVTANVEPKSSNSIGIFVEPISAKPGIHAVNINVRSKRTDQVVSVAATVTLRNPAGSKQYVPTVMMEVVMPKDINPKDPVPIKVELSNQNPLDIPDLAIKIDSENWLLQKTVVTGIGPKEKKTVEIAVVLNKTTPPQPDIVYFSLLRGNETIAGPIKKNIEIIEYSDIVPVIEPKKSFIKTDNAITFANDGNVVYEGIVKTETSFLKNMFTSTTPTARTKREEGVRYLTWEVSLGAGEEFNTRVVVNYRPLLLILVLLGIAGGLYYQFRSPLIIKKTVADIRKDEGGIAGVKIILNVTNRGKNIVKDLELTDRVPDLVEVEQELSIGSLQPSKILKHEKKGMLLKWNIHELEPDEERVITYRVRSKLSILGEFMLPPMNASFRYMGRDVKSNSNRLYINS